MKKAIILGGAGGLAVYAAYAYWIQRKSWPNGVPLGNVLNIESPFLYGFVGVGALLGYALR